MILDYIIPKICINCGLIGDYLCKDCKKELKPHFEMCPYCHRYSKGYKKCVNCIGKENVMEGVIIPFEYNKLIKKIIMNFKYYHKYDLIEYIVDRLYFAYITSGLPPDITITYIPSHRKRKYFAKGYNQSEILAKLLAKRVGCNYIKIGKKIKNTSSQANLNREKRLKNLKGAFKIKTNIKINTKTLLIIDDVITTGATLNQYAKAIKKNYDIKIWALVICHHFN